MPRAWLLALLLPLGAAGLDETPSKEPAAAEEPAPAEETAPAAEPSFSVGVIEVLRDRVGGSLNLVRKLSRQVEIVRAGNEFGAEPAFELGPGDAVRTRDGIAAVQAGNGRRLEIGERSQVRFDADQATMRLGTLLVDTPAAYSILVGDSLVTTEGGVVLVKADLRGTGVLSVLIGSATVSNGAETRTVAAMHTTELGGSPELRPLAPTEADAIATERVTTFATPEARRSPVTSEDRAHIIMAGGLIRTDRNDHALIELSTRVRIAGPAWLHVGGGVTLRPADELAGYNTVLTIPARVGVRFIAELPRSVFLEGGADFSLLFGERCTSLDGCPREFSVEPGGWADIGIGLYIHPRVGIQLELAAGVYRRRLPPPNPAASPIIFPELQAQGLIGVFVRL